jgi:hypothetical protein
MPMIPNREPETDHGDAGPGQQTAGEPDGDRRDRRTVGAHDVGRTPSIAPPASDMSSQYVNASNTGTSP